MSERPNQPDAAIAELLKRIAGGEVVKPGEHAAIDAAVKEGLVAQDPKGHLTLTARGRHLVTG